MMCPSMASDTFTCESMIFFSYRCLLCSRRGYDVRAHHDMSLGASFGWLGQRVLDMD